MEFAVYLTDGDVVRIIRVPTFDLSVSDDEIRAERRARLGWNPSERNRDLLSAMPDPETRPAYSDLVVDSDGFIWAEESRGRTLTMTDGLPSKWNVFSPDGEWLGRVQIPHRFFVFEIGSDYVLGRRYDEEDVEHVELLRLTRG
jgi:sugar lactone lactonase YvrE